MILFFATIIVFLFPFIFGTLHFHFCSIHKNILSGDKAIISKMLF